LTENYIIDIINNYYTAFLYKKNVVGMAFGNKLINNIDTKEPCLQIFVKEKIPSNKLLNYEIIPKIFKGIKTDVIESGVFEFNGSSNKNLKDIALLKEAKRPIQSGFEISPLAEPPVPTGTLGAIVFDNESDTPYILSSSHVLSNYNKLPMGTPIIQPAKKIINTQTSNNQYNKVIAYLYKKTFLNYSLINTYSQGYKFSEIEFNYADCAIAKITSNTSYNKEIYKIGTIKGIKEPKVGLKIKKIGKATGLTTATITSIDGIYNVTFENYLFAFKNCITCEKICKPGDSGSLVLDYYNRVIGLLIGSSVLHDVITPINPILN
ncbi:hypothetical protein, partial [Clostridium tarantellae]|uniref:hypothetical protein n=1 Tax=Clostridium tarantellae TaxID=39493 RepID=UPI0014791599